MLHVVCLLFVAGVAVAQEHCCAPPQYEGYEDFVFGFTRLDERPDAVLGVNRVHFDLHGNRVAITHYTKFENSGEEREFRIIDNFEERRRIFVEGGSCTISALEGELRPSCVSEEAEHVGDFRIGIGPNAQILEDWRERGPHHVIAYQTTRVGCYPFLYKHAHIAHDGETVSYINIVSNNRYTEGIEDDRVFETPEECRTVRYTPDYPQTLKDVEQRFIKQ